MKRAICLWLALLLFLTGCNAATPEPVRDLPEEEAAPVLHGEYEVVRVVDGDTIIVDLDGKDTRIRLIGIDTPESVHPDKSKNSEEGIIASDFTKELLTGEKVYLEYDIEKIDQYDRTLAYVYLADGETMVNALLVEEGYATTMTVQPNSKYADTFYELQKEAREQGRGFWAEE